MFIFGIYNCFIQILVMKKLLFSLFFILGNYHIQAQCGEVGVQLIVSNQTQLDELSSCELFSGDLIISSANITNLDALSQLSIVVGSFYLINTLVSDLSPLSSLNSAYQILIQGNTGLTSCCAFIQFNTALELGSVLNLAISNNGAFCDDENSVMLECLGFIEGCTDTVALNFNELASVDDGSCAYFCPESVNDMQDYSCKDSAYPENCEAIVTNIPSSGAGHYNNPIGLCYDQNPPSSGPHRSMWGRWGEYEYMPPQRYIHNLEHGGIAFLYNPCASPDIIESLRLLACSFADDDGGPFRWVMTPYVDLPSNIAVIAWEWSYSNNCFEESSINSFIDEHYRNAPEDFYYNGSYDTLYLGKCEAYGCNDPAALNFESTSLLDNGSCFYPIIDSQLVSFVAGWSLFSTYIEPQYMSMDSVFQPIIDQTIIVKNNTGEAFLPVWNMDMDMENGQGYQSKLTEASEIYIQGTQIQPELNPINLNAGWNIIAYLREEPADCIMVFDDIVTQITIVKDGLGNVYLPEWGFDNINQMSAGKGYQVKALNSATLLYLANDEEY